LHGDSSTFIFKKDVFCNEISTNGGLVVVCKAFMKVLQVFEQDIKASHTQSLEVLSTWILLEFLSSHHVDGFFFEVCCMGWEGACTMPAGICHVSSLRLLSKNTTGCPPKHHDMVTQHHFNLH
jgi:hypothetical protein